MNYFVIFNKGYSEGDMRINGNLSRNITVKNNLSIVELSVKFNKIKNDYFLNNYYY